MTAHDMEHDRLREASGLYVLGALDSVGRAEFERHLATCAVCAEEVRSLSGVASALPHGVPLIEPPASLRSRVLSVTGRPTSVVVTMTPRAAKRTASASAGWLSAAALLLVSAGLGAYSWSLTQQLGGMEERLRDAVARLDRSDQQVAVATRVAAMAESRMAVITASDMRQVDLEGQPAAPLASGRAFWSRSRGLVFTAASLPPAPAGRVYQLWMVTATAPVSAGLLSPDSNGRVAQAFDTSTDIPAPVAIAVTLEPSGGVPAPSGARYLVGLSH